MENKNQIIVKVKGGFLRAMPAEDINYPGIWVEFVSDKESEVTASHPSILVEQEPFDNPNSTVPNIRALLWTNPNQEDYTDEIYLTDHE